MKILVSNDDGVYAEGIRVLAHTLEEIAKVQIVAPDRNRSGASNSLTLDAPLRAKTIETGAISVEGTPTDCVHVAITGLLDFEPDMVVSGINENSNLGDDVWYSGTVAAAIEGRFLGFPAIAVSLVNRGNKHYDTAAKAVLKLVKQLQADPLPPATILNVNVPDIPYEALKGFEVTRLGTRHRAEAIVAERDPRGREIFWIGPPGSEQDAGPGTDFHAVAQHKVSITPIKVDLTNYEAFNQLAAWTIRFTEQLP